MATPRCCTDVRGGQLNQRVVFERKVVVQDDDFGTELVRWDTVTTVWANVTESHTVESVAHNIRTTTRSISVRTRWVDGITTDMRLRDSDSGRLYQIVSLAEMRKRLGLNLVVEEYSV